jgi:hypothetical protein
MPIRFVAAGAVIVCLLAGCTVPDGRLLAPSAQRPDLATVQMTEAQSGRVPLVTIAAAAGPEDYVSALAGAVQAAKAAKPDVIFDVLSAVPQKGTPLHQITEARGLPPDAAEVATAILGDAGHPGERGARLRAVAVSGRRRQVLAAGVPAARLPPHPMRPPHPIGLGHCCPGLPDASRASRRWI